MPVLLEHETRVNMTHLGLEAAGYGPRRIRTYDYHQVHIAVPLVNPHPEGGARLVQIKSNH